MNQSTRSTAFNLVSYARAHDYFSHNAGSEPAKWTDLRENTYLRVVLDEISDQNAVPALLLRVATLTNDMYSGNSQGAFQNESHVGRLLLLVCGNLLAAVDLMVECCRRPSIFLSSSEY